MSIVPIDEIRVDASLAGRLPDPGPEAFEGLVADVRARGILVDLLVTSGVCSWKVTGAWLRRARSAWSR